MMPQIQNSLILILLLTGSLTIQAGAGDTPLVGPNGGRILIGNPVAEFWVTPERKIQITFLDEKHEPLPRDQHQARATALLPGERQTIEFEPAAGTLLATTALPEGDGYVIVVQLRKSPDSRPTNHRITYEDHLCSGCNLMEYACTCQH